MLDAFIVYRFIRQLSKPFKDWKAYETGVIDDKGKLLKRIKDLKTREEKDSFTRWHLLILNLKKMIEKIPGSNKEIYSYAAALYLIKENISLEENNFLIESSNTEDLINEENFIKFLKEEGESNAIAGSTTNGAVEGIGPNDEPIVGRNTSPISIKRKKLQHWRKFLRNREV